MSATTWDAEAYDRQAAPQLAWGRVVLERLDLRGDETVLDFTQGGWAEPVPFQAHCTTKWGLFLLGMKSLLEGGQATPYPGELQISSWG